MPNIEEYINREKAPAASSAGSEAFEIEGRHIESAFSEGGSALGRGIAVVGKEVQQHDELQDSSQISAESAKAFAEMSSDLDQTMRNADPNKIDDTADKWRDKQSGAIDNLFQNVRTSQGEDMAARMRSTLRQEATRSSMSYQSTIAGQAVVQNLDTTKNYLAQGVSANPSMLPTALAIMQNGLDEQLKNHTVLSADEVAKVRDQYGNKTAKDLGIAAYKTMAESNPEEAMKELNDPKGMLGGLFSGEELATLNTFGQTQIKIAEAASRSAETENRRLEDDAYVAAQDKFVAGMIKPNGSISVGPSDWKQVSNLLSMPHTELGAGRSLIDFMRGIDKGAGAAHSDMPTYAEFTNRVAADTLTQNDILRASADGLLSKSDTAHFINTLNSDPAKKAAEKDFNAWATAQKGGFTKAVGVLGLSDPQGMARWQQFYQAAHDQFQSAYETKSDWKDLMRQGSKDYLGNLAPRFMPGKGNANVPISGTVVQGMKFNGTTADDWKNPKMWSKVGQ